MPAISAQPIKGERRDIEDGTNSISSEIESWRLISRDYYQLHEIEKKAKHRGRTIIPTSANQRLLFMCGYVTTPFRFQWSFPQGLDPVRFYWSHAKNGLFRNLITNYIHLFLAAYSPEHPMFLSKMVKLLYGAKLQIVVASILGLVASAEIIVLFMDYMVQGVLHGVPWFQCMEPMTWVHPVPAPYMCVTADQFRFIVKNHTFNTTSSNELPAFIRESNAFQLPNKTLMLPANMVFFMSTWSNLDVLQSRMKILYIVYFFLVWAIAGLCYKQLYARRIWKFTFIMQLVCSVINLTVLLHLLLHRLGSDAKFLRAKLDEVFLDQCENFDFLFYAEIFSGPPVVYMLYTRSIDEVNPGPDSFVLTSVCSIAIILHITLNVLIKEFVESQFHCSLIWTTFNHLPIFTFWSYYFQFVPFGEFLSQLFYMLHGITEFAIFIITYQILVDIIVYEWKNAKRWAVTIIISITGIVLSIALKHVMKMLLYIMNAGVTGLTEIVGIVLLYPLGRFMNDIQFHTGAPVHLWRKFLMWLMPLYSMMKFNACFQESVGLYELYKSRIHIEVHRDFSCSLWAWMVCCVVLGIGTLYAIYMTIYRLKSPMKLFIPCPNWGPKDCLTRQLRKQFDARNFVASQSARFLSRDQFAKGQAPTIDLGLHYGRADTRRRSTFASDGVKHEADRKSKPLSVRSATTFQA